MGRVQGKVVMVTGCASNPGLGYTTACMLANEGAKLIVTDINGEGAEACAEEIRSSGGDALPLKQDVTDQQHWQDCMDAAVTTYGRLDVLVNNAGIAILKSFTDLTLEDFNLQLNVNLTGAFLGCQSAMRQMRQQGEGGVLINISSIAALAGMNRTGGYAASKGGIRAMSRVVAIDGAPDNIRCNTIFPGVIRTNMQTEAAGKRSVDSRATNSRVPLGRAGEPSDIGHTIVYLASDEAQYVTGAEFTIDAGFSAQ